MTHRKAGIEVLEDWIAQCVAHLAQRGSISKETNITIVLNKVLEIFLNSDIYECAEDVNLLPENLQVI